MAEVRIQRIVKEFGPVRAVDDVSLTIHDKEFLVLLGPSGCGKTTLLRALAAAIPPHERLVTIEDVLELGLEHDPAHPDVVAMQAREPNVEGRGGIGKVILDPTRT